MSLIDQANRVNIREYQPLPFDDEYEETTEDDVSFYQEAIKSFEKPS